MALLGNLAGPSKTSYPPSGSSSSSSYFSSNSTPTSRFRLREQDLSNPLQYLSLYDSIPVDTTKCEKCENSKPDSWKCIDCQTFFCISCLIDHQNHQATKDHNVVHCRLRRSHTNSGSLSSSSRESTSPPLYSSASFMTQHFCDIHGEAHKLYCEKCIRTYCVSCNDSPLRPRNYEMTNCNHNLITVQQAIDRAKENTTTFEIEIENINREIKEEIRKIEMSKMNNEKLFFMVQCDIVENYKRMHERFLKLMRSLADEKREKDRNIDVHKTRLDTMQRKIFITSQILKESLLSDDPWDMIIAKERASRDLRMFKQCELNLLYSDENEITFQPPEDDIFRRLPISDFRSQITRNIAPKNRPIFGIPRQVYVRRPEQNSISLIIGGQGVEEGLLCRPWGVACNSKGQIIVADRSNDRIQIFNLDGSFFKAFGTHGNGCGEFDRPAGVAVSSNGNIVVADKDNHRIQIFNSDGEFLKTFGRKGSYTAQFNYPWDVACNSRNQIVVSDSRNHRLQLFDENGVYIRSYGYELSAACYKNFDTPRGVCFAPNDDVIITDFNNHKLIRIDVNFEKNPKYIGCEGTEFRQFKRPQGVICDDRGNIIIADSRNERIQVLDSNGNFLWSVGTGGSGNGELDTPSGICLTPDGRIVVVDYGNHRVQIF